MVITSNHARSMPLEKVTKALTDGGGSTIQSIDQLSKMTSFTYEASGNQLSVHDPNNVGQDVVYDALGRSGLTTDEGASLRTESKALMYRWFYQPEWR